MPSLINKAFHYLQRRGVAETAVRIMRYPFLRIAENRFKRRALALHTRESRYTAIYLRGSARNKDNFSGTGSTLEYTSNLRQELPKLLDRLGVKTVLDVPCGDFYWMKHLLAEVNVEYIGGDIVLPLIESHNARHKNAKTTFVHIDLTADRLPGADIMICRDCLFHLSFHDIDGFLQNFVESGIPFLLTTTHINEGLFRNRDIVTGDFRLLDLFSSPFFFPQEVAHRIADWIEPGPKREMCLWTRKQMVEVVAARDQSIGGP